MPRDLATPHKTFQGAPGRMDSIILPVLSIFTVLLRLSYSFLRGKLIFFNNPILPETVSQNCNLVEAEELRFTARNFLFPGEYDGFSGLGNEVSLFSEVRRGCRCMFRFSSDRELERCLRVHDSLDRCCYLLWSTDCAVLLLMKLFNVHGTENNDKVKCSVTLSLFQ